MDHKISYGLARARTTLSLMALVLRCSNSVQTSHVSPQVDQKADSERVSRSRENEMSRGG